LEKCLLDVETQNKTKKEYFIWKVRGSKEQVTSFGPTLAI
jgi:hypothetical protein